jgi:hypothetical protein
MNDMLKLVVVTLRLTHWSCSVCHLLRILLHVKTLYFLIIRFPYKLLLLLLLLLLLNVEHICMLLGDKHHYVLFRYI